MDIVGRWLEDRCQLDPNKKEKVSVLHADYETWAMNEIGFSMSVIAFGRELASRGFERVKVDNERHIRGLCLPM